MTTTLTEVPALRLTRGAAFFLTHAQGLLPDDPVRELHELRDAVLRLVIGGHLARSLAA